MPRSGWTEFIRERTEKAVLVAEDSTNIIYLCESILVKYDLFFASAFLLDNFAGIQGRRRLICKASATESESKSRNTVAVYRTRHPVTDRTL
eukprot:6177651-Pleurochrysis_carterae.AAC.1